MKPADLSLAEIIEDCNRVAGIALSLYVSSAKEYKTADGKNQRDRSAAIMTPDRVQKDGSDLNSHGWPLPGWIKEIDAEWSSIVSPSLPFPYKKSPTIGMPSPWLCAA